jgi:hypothetical protein
MERGSALTTSEEQDNYLDCGVVALSRRWGADFAERKYEAVDTYPCVAAAPLETPHAAATQRHNINGPFWAR